MLALLLLCVAGTLLVTVGMPILLWTLSMETLRERAALAAAPTSIGPGRVYSLRSANLEALTSCAV